MEDGEWREGHSDSSFPEHQGVRVLRLRVELWKRVRSYER